MPVLDGPIVNVVRSFGGLTEPFIAQRVRVLPSHGASELWFEASVASPGVRARRVRVTGMAPRTFGDRLFHRVPQIGPPLAHGYAAAERIVKPRLIHAHFATTGYLVGAVTERPLVVSAYGFDVSVMARRRLWQRAYQRLADRVERILVEGPAMRARVIEIGFPAERVSVVRIAADLESIAFRPPTDDHRGPVRLLACGRLVEKKGHAIAIRAFSLIRHRLPKGSRLEIIGDGPLGPALRRSVEELGLRDAVSLPGALPRSAFHEALRTADLFLAPSVEAANGDSEGGAPTTVLDAQATGTIVVASTHADIPYLVTDGETGYLAPEGDVEAFASRILEALDDRDRWPRMSAEARAAAVDLHSDRSVGDALKAIYLSVAG